MTADMGSSQAAGTVAANLDIGLIPIFSVFVAICIAFGAVIGKAIGGRKGAAMGAVVAALLAPVVWVATWPLWMLRFSN